MTNDDIVDTLNDLIATGKDGESGFTACAKHAISGELKRQLADRALECQRAAAELQPYVIQYGGKPSRSGSASEALHRGWVAVRGSLGGLNEAAVLEECEREEGVALTRYRKALSHATLPSALRTVVERQLEGVKHHHDQIKLLRDRVKAIS